MYIDESNGNKNLTLVSTNDEGKDTLKKYEELRSKIKYFIRSTTNNSGSYDSIIKSYSIQMMVYL